MYYAATLAVSERRGVIHLLSMIELVLVVLADFFFVFFFFFQAEDGIRDLTVTGVQTCALPISILRVSITFAGLTRYCRQFVWTIRCTRRQYRVRPAKVIETRNMA